MSDTSKYKCNYGEAPLDILQDIFMKALTRSPCSDFTIADLIHEWNAAIEYCNDVLTFKE